MYHLILNPVAGKKKSLKNLAAVEKELSARGISYQVHKTCGEKDGTTIAKELTKAGEEELIVLGGDGTLHEVLNGIEEPSRCKIGLIPSGTGNDFATRAGLPLDAEKAIGVILDGEAKPTDFLTVGKVRCMNIAGIGLDVEVLERCKRGRMKGKLKYLFSLVQSLFSYKGITVTAISEGREEEHDVLIAAACNGAQFGGGIAICPVADIEDGKMDVVVVERIGGKMKIIKAFLKLLKGKILEYPAATHYVADSVRFVPKTPCTVQLDGELYTDLDFEVCVGKGLRFYR